MRGRSCKASPASPRLPHAQRRPNASWVMLGSGCIGVDIERRRCVRAPLEDQQAQRPRERVRGRSCEARPGRRGLPAGCARGRQDALFGHAPRDMAQHQPRLYAR